MVDLKHKPLLRACHIHSVIKFLNPNPNSEVLTQIYFNFPSGLTIYIEKASIFLNNPDESISKCHVMTSSKQSEIVHTYITF